MFRTATEKADEIIDINTDDFRQSSSLSRRLKGTIFSTWEALTSFSSYLGRCVSSLFPERVSIRPNQPLAAVTALVAFAPTTRASAFDLDDTSTEGIIAKVGVVSTALAALVILRICCRCLSRCCGNKQPKPDQATLESIKQQLGELTHKVQILLRDYNFGPPAIHWGDKESIQNLFSSMKNAVTRFHTMHQSQLAKMRGIEQQLQIVYATEHRSLPIFENSSEQSTISIPEALRNLTAPEGAQAAPIQIVIQAPASDDSEVTVETLQKGISTVEKLMREVQKAFDTYFEETEDEEGNKIPLYPRKLFEDLLSFVEASFKEIQRLEDLRNQRLFAMERLITRQSSDTAREAAAIVLAVQQEQAAAKKEKRKKTKAVTTTRTVTAEALRLMASPRIQPAVTIEDVSDLLDNDGDDEKSLGASTTSSDKGSRSTIERTPSERSLSETSEKSASSGEKTPKKKKGPTPPPRRYLQKESQDLKQTAAAYAEQLPDAEAALPI